MLSLAVLSMSIVAHSAKSKISDHASSRHLQLWSWGLKTMESYETDAPKNSTVAYERWSFKGRFQLLGFECTWSRTWNRSKMDSKPLLLPTRTNANNAIKVSKVAGRQKLASAGKLALNFSVRNCATSFVKLAGNNATTVTGNDMSQMSSNSLLRGSLFQAFSPLARRKEMRAGNSDEQRPALWLCPTLHHLNAWDRLYSVQSLGPKSRNAPRPHAICDFGLRSWRRENQEP